MLRLLSAIVSNLCETPAGLEVKLEADLNRFFSSSAEIRRIYPVADENGQPQPEASLDGPVVEGEEPTNNETSDVEMKSTSGEAAAQSDGPKSSEERVVSLDKMVENLYPYLRRDPQTFRSVISRMCCLYIEAPHASDTDTTMIQSSEAPSGATFWLALTTSSSHAENKRGEAVNAAAAEVLPILVDYLDLFTSIHVSSSVRAT